MNTTATNTNTTTANITTTAAAITAPTTRLSMPLQSRLPSLALAAVLTLSMLAGVDLLATGQGNTSQPQLAQSSTSRA